MLTSESKLKHPMPIDFDGGPDTIRMDREEIPNPLAALEQPADVGREVRAFLKWVSIVAGSATVALFLIKVALTWGR